MHNPRQSIERRDPGCADHKTRQPPVTKCYKNPQIRILQSIRKPPMRLQRINIRKSFESPNEEVQHAWTVHKLFVSHEHRQMLDRLYHATVPTPSR